MRIGVFQPSYDYGSALGMIKRPLFFKKNKHYEFCQ